MRLTTLSLTAAILGAASLAPSSAAASVTQKEAELKVAEDFGVEVLSKRTRAGDIDGRAVWFLTVMNPGGTSNGAFQVNTLAVDRKTGKLVPAFRHRSSGYDLPGAVRLDDQSNVRPDMSGSRPWR
ncbi:MAG: hypothetical protein MI785_02110 [Kiloniellales bacterium]|nr:hypothetical protein [Kiloniellales bacterium]